MVAQSDNTFKRAIQKSTTRSNPEPDDTEGHHPRFKIPLPFLRWFGYGSVLFILFCFEIYFGIVTLSAHQLHHRVRDIDINGDKSVIVSQLNEFDIALAKVEDDFESATSDIEDLLYMLDAYKAELSTLQRDNNDLGSEALDLEAQVALLNAAVAADDPEDSNIAAEKLPHAETQLAANKRNLAKINRSIAFIEKNQFQVKCDIVRQVIAADNIRVIQTSRLLNDYGFGIPLTPTDGLDTALALGEYFNLHQDVTGTQTGNLKDSECNLPDIQRGKISVAMSRQLADARNDIRYFTNREARQDLREMNNLTRGVAADATPAKSGSVWTLFNFPALITWPQQMLTIIVVLIMGALGATISVTRTYLDKDMKPWLPAYIFMPLLGAVTGFVVFVLAKAGVLIISDGGSNGSGAYLSPYFISFIGLVSGMLVIDALDTITKIGRTWFSSSSEGVKRWAVGLENEAADEALVAKISGKLNEKAYKVKAWLNADEDVPPRTQSDLAFILDKDIRAIFTDIPPQSPQGDEATT